MQTLSLFPSLLTWNQLAPFMIRIVLGLVLAHWAWKALHSSAASPISKGIAAAEGVSGLLLVIGLWTQAAALYAAIDLLIRLFEHVSKKAFLTDGINYYLILLVLALSLLVAGAGLFSLDLPL